MSNFDSRQTNISQKQNLHKFSETFPLQPLLTVFRHVEDRIWDTLYKLSESSELKIVTIISTRQSTFLVKSFLYVLTTIVGFNCMK